MRNYMSTNNPNKVGQLFRCASKLPQSAALTGAPAAGRQGRHPRAAPLLIYNASLTSFPMSYQSTKVDCHDTKDADPAVREIAKVHVALKKLEEGHR
ncbi:MAG: hypothetical protein A2075_22720 [Geobacteraceae bacterium GWC2_58_44]|nr:MAG: hypothetical protein A2075_22720 [Geobacteraceae bacterium GWC2_58_44]HBG04158.1 hypothetical protein [Geobacter sp.]